MRRKRLVINVVSGKGGTGKTLLTAVLAEILGNNNVRVLVIDLDVFVRGLTALLYYHKGEAIQLTEHEKAPVSEYFIYPTRRGGKKQNLAIEHYRSFDVVPSVRMVNELLPFQNIMPDSRDEAKAILKTILASVPDEYEVILLDSRAGYDELISATHSICDMSICVTEDDNISAITADNLIEQLRQDSSKPVFILRNKVRDSVKSMDNIKSAFRLSNVGFIGDIPFDIDVLNSFGSSTFWDDISKSMYKEALIEAWNELSNKMKLEISIKSRRTSPVFFKQAEKKLGFLSLFDRLIFINGITLGIAGLFLYFINNEHAITFKYISNTIPLLIAVFGIFMSIYIVFKSGKK